MVFKLSARLLAAGFLIAASTFTKTADAAEFLLRFASINVEGTAVYEQVFKPFAEAVNRDSDGRIEVALKPVGGYGKPADLFNMVERGDIEIASTVQGYNPGRFPQSSVMELPMMFDSSVSGTRAIMGMLHEGLLDKDYAAVKPLALYVLAPYGIFTTGRTLSEVKDLRGLRVRTPSPTIGLAANRLGMIPIGVPVNMIGDAITSGIVDAITFGWDSLTTTKNSAGSVLSDQVSVLIDANFAAPAMMVVMNKAKWDTLPPDLQAIIDKDSANLAADNARMRDQVEIAARARLKADPRYSYIALTAAQRAEMERRIQPAVSDWKNGMIRNGFDADRLYTRAEELVRQSSVAGR